MLQAQYIFLHKMVQELINHDYEVTDDEGETLYESTSLYQNVQPCGAIYENTMMQ